MTAPEMTTTECYTRVYFFDAPADIEGLSENTSLDSSFWSTMTVEQADRELVATNRMAIVNAACIQGKATIQHVDLAEGDEIPDSGLWWRTRFDIMNKTIS